MSRARSSWFLALAFVACGDDTTATTDTLATAPDAAETTANEVAQEVTTGAETTPETAVDETADTSLEEIGETSDSEVAACEHPCLNAFGKNDKSLCPAPQADWNCTEGCCAPVFNCQEDKDCTTTGFALEQCLDERFDCRCHADTGACYTWYCAANSECASGLCAGGACIPQPSRSKLEIRILDRAPVLTPGATFQLHVEAYDPDDANAVVAVTPTWTAETGAVVDVNATGLLTGGATAGKTTITAHAGDKTASIDVVNVVPDPTDTLTVIVRTELTGEPVTGTYAVTTPTGESVALAPIPADGILRVATATGQPADGWTLHVFADNNDWVTWQGLATGQVLDLALPKTVYSKIELDPTGAVVAEGTTLHNTGVLMGTPDFGAYQYGSPSASLELVVTTYGLSSALFDFSLPVLLGADVKRYLDPNHHIPRVSASDPLTIPGGVVFNLAGPAIPYFVLGAPAGKRGLWTLGGRLDLTDISEYSGKIIDAIAGGHLDFTAIVGAVFPLFKGFWSGYVPETEVVGVGDPTKVTTVNPVLTTPMGIVTNLAIAPLPTLADLGWADGLFLLGGAETVDGFMVALGLNGGADTADKDANPADGLADSNERTPAIDPFALPMAPLHTGLNGPHTRFLITAVAASIPADGNDKRPSAGSAVLVRFPAGERPPTSLTLPAFLGFPMEGDRFDADLREVTSGEVGATDMLRILIKGKTGRHWTIYGVTPGKVIHIANPADFGVTSDRLARDDLDSVLINAIDFAEDVGVNDVGRPGGVSLDMLLAVVDRVSFIDIKKPLQIGPR